MTTPSDSSYREIPLTQGKVAIVDAEDYERLSHHKWYAKKDPTGHIYALRHTACGVNKQRTVFMHREVLGLTFKDGILSDHINPEATLDNRKCNLRKSTNQQNQYNQRITKRNKTGFKGVHQRPDGSYRVDIRIGKNKKTVGRFWVLEDAARCYDRYALANFGEFAHINFPRSDYLDSATLLVDHSNVTTF